ncbi:MAG: glycosyl hydrolase family 28-related protein [Candidatus Sulfotelmatobacter sp.]
MFSRKQYVSVLAFGILFTVLGVVCVGNAQTTTTFSVTTGGITELEVAGPSPWIDATAPLYGADPTGTSDSTAAINAAIAACNGGTVFLPPGTYKQSGQLLGATPCTVMGLGPAEGAGASIILKSYSSTGGFSGGQWIVPDIRQ